MNTARSLYRDPNLTLQFSISDVNRVWVRKQDSATGNNGGQGMELNRRRQRLSPPEPEQPDSIFILGEQRGPSGGLLGDREGHGTDAVSTPSSFLTIREKFQKVFRSSPIPFSITTLKEGRFLDVNAAFERRYGYAREEALGHTVHELRIWEDPADRVLMIEQLQRGGPIRNVITRLRTKSGEVKLTAYSADRIQFDGQSCILAVSEDLPEYDKGKVN